MTSDADLPRPGRPRRADVAALVLAAARELISRQGYAGTSVDQIAAAAGVAKTTVYRRWPAKSDLAVDALADGLGPPPAPARERRTSLYDAVAWLADRVRDPTVHHLLLGLLGEAAHDPVLRERLRARIRTPYEDALVARWQVGRAAADLAFDVVVGSVLHHVTMTGSVAPSVVDAIAGLAAGLLVPDAQGD